MDNSKDRKSKITYRESTNLRFGIIFEKVPDMISETAMYPMLIQRNRMHFCTAKRKTKEAKFNESIKRINSSVRIELRRLNSDIRKIEREQAKLISAIKEVVKRSNNKDVVAILVTELCTSRKDVAKLYKAQTQIESLSIQLKEHFALVKLSSSVQKSTDVMKCLQQLYQTSSSAMKNIAKELIKAKIIDEMVTDIFDDSCVEDERDLEEYISHMLREIEQGILPSLSQKYEFTSSKIPETPFTAKNRTPTEISLTRSNSQPNKLEFLLE
ncbi:hypothetical protein GJ496_003323 [Pomphorhynchus laevis]|nr:hypothetical protein GJ496_003323 [Pomphorhynchus laevis]